MYSPGAGNGNGLPGNPHLDLDDGNKRKPNFSDSEKFFLVRQYEAYRNVLCSRDGGSNKDKQFIWKVIAEELNKRNPLVVRTPMEVRKKWQNLLTFGRKEIKEAEIRGTPSHLLPWIWRKVYELAGPGNAADEEDFRGGSLDLSASGSGFDAVDPFMESPFDCPDAHNSPPATGSAIVISSSKTPVIDLEDIKSEPSWNQAQSKPSSEDTQKTEEPPVKRWKPENSLAPIRRRTESPKPSLPSTSKVIPEPSEPFPDTTKTKCTNKKARDVSLFGVIDSNQQFLDEDLRQKREMFELTKRKKEVEIELLELDKERKILENELLRKKIAHEFPDKSSSIG